MATKIGSFGPDTLRGTDGGDLLVGMAGDDCLLGRSGSPGDPPDGAGRTP